MSKAHTFDGLIEFDRSLQVPFAGSIAFHIAIVIALSLSLPFIKPDSLNISKPIPVELIEIDEMTQTNKPKTRAKPDNLEPPTAKPAPPKVDTMTPPDLTKPEAPDVDVALPRMVESVKPLQKPAPPAKPEESKPNDFASLLKNLVPDAGTERVEEPEAEEGTESQLADLSERLTISEEDALRRQLSQCWNVMAGAKYAEDLVVRIRVVVNPDRTVQNATILDKALYNRDTHFRAAADAAMRALRNPKCTPLELPADKYEEWKVTTINFDPREML